MSRGLFNKICKNDLIEQKIDGFETAFCLEKRKITPKVAFCFQNCTDLLWENIALVIEDNFWNWEIVVSEGSNFDTDPYESWALTSHAKIWNLIKVGEADSLASGGFRSDRRQNEKKSEAKILESPISYLQKRNIPQKKPQENHH